MIRTRIEKERREQEWLAPYAQKSGDSAGRVHAEPLHPHRTAYERDRARAIVRLIDATSMVCVRRVRK